MAQDGGETRNTVFVGDNFEVMKGAEFQKYAGKVGMIYIDPPYNTQSKKSYKDTADSEAWSEFMAKRLELAREIMREDAAIFISIDDNEFANLRLCGDAVFGTGNFVGTMITRQAQRSNAKFINTVHEYILCYAKDIKKLRKFSVRRTDIPEQRKMILSLQAEITEAFRTDGRKAAQKMLNRRIRELCEESETTWLKNYSSLDSEGRIFFGMDLSVPGEPREVEIPEIGLKLEPLRTRSWATEARFIELAEAGRLSFKAGRPYAVKYLTEAEDNIPSVLNFYSRQGTHDLKRLGLQGVFDTPKPVGMLKFLIRATGVRGSFVLDFFAGSGSTGQAVYETNEEDKRDNKFILIQTPEEVNRKSGAYKKCLELGITPRIDRILEFRLKKFLEKQGKEADFVVISPSESGRRSEQKSQSRCLGGLAWQCPETILQSP